MAEAPRGPDYHALTEPAEWRIGTIARSHVADFLVRQIDSADYLHKVPLLAE